ncbi:MAG: ccr4 associated factor [Geoglossum umbratile]|nr:MAG: ccr4 associated factor [Geoglossum umbratile]
MLPHHRRRICTQCLSLLRRSYSTKPEPILPPHPPATGIAKLTDRRLIALHGQDSTSFLQGVVTNNVRPGETRGFYAAFLNAQGRVLADVFIYPSAQNPHYRSTVPLTPGSPQPNEPSYLIEVSSDTADSLLAHIRRHKLRAKFSARILDPENWSIYSIWNDKQKWTPFRALEPGDGAYHEIGCVDVRAPGMGRRVVVGRGERGVIVDESIEESPLDVYTLRRILHGVPEGPFEILPTTALPHESNIDYMSGVDFRKGCYVGQELTIRTHHTGIVRKRILPIQLYLPPSPPPQTLTYNPGSNISIQAPQGVVDISRVDGQGRSKGKLLRAVGNVGLALCRLESMTDTVLTGEGSAWSAQDEFRVLVGGGEVRIKAFVPKWHHKAPAVG